jgi:hypothetical protein
MVGLGLHAEGLNFFIVLKFTIRHLFGSRSAMSNLYHRILNPNCYDLKFLPNNCRLDNFGFQILASVNPL